MGETEMPKYKSHKEVWATKIKDILVKEGEDSVNTGGATITPEEEGYGPFEVSREYVEKHSPEVGGYYVVYKGGYKSFSPADAFEEGFDGNITFNKDNTYESSFDGDIETGTWTLSSDGMTMTLDPVDDDILMLDVVTLNSNTLIIALTETENEDFDGDGTEETLTITVQISFTKAS